MPFPDPPQPPSARHPLDGSDRPLVEGLLHVATPSDHDIVTAARLHTRYRDSRLSADLLATILQALERWSLTLDELQSRARLIWQSGWRPPLPAQGDEQPVGSGADVEG